MAPPAFVGRRAAAYLAQHPMRRKLRWAIAGRDAGKLAALREELEGDAASVTLPALVIGRQPRHGRRGSDGGIDARADQHGRAVCALRRCDRRCLRAPAHALRGHQPAKPRGCGA